MGQLRTFIVTINGSLGEYTYVVQSNRTMEQMKEDYVMVREIDNVEPDKFVLVGMEQKLRARAI